MLTFLANPRDGSSSGASQCNACCCELVTIKPGETNRWAINYANWVAGIGGRGLYGDPSFEVADITPTPGQTGTNVPPTNTDYVFFTPFGTPLSGVVTASAVSDLDPLVYKLLPIFGPEKGSVTLNHDGSFVYTPFAGSSGYFTFWFTTTDILGQSVTNKATVVVQPQAPSPALPAPPIIPRINIPRDMVKVQTPLISFPVVASPALRTGDLYRMTVRAAAVDCEGQAYYHLTCFDVAIGKC